MEVDLGHGLGNMNRGFEFFGDSRRFDRFVANRSLQSRMDSPEVDSLYTGTGVGNLLRFESIRSIRCESSLPKSNRHTGSLFTLGNNAGWEFFLFVNDLAFIVRVRMATSVKDGWLFRRPYAFISFFICYSFCWNEFFKVMLFYFGCEKVCLW